MKSKYLTIAFTSLLVLSTCLTNIANAGLITVDEWHDTSDGYNGLKQSTFSDDIFYAVSRTGVFNNTENYEMISGFRMATRSEYLAEYAANGPGAGHVYHGTGGWSGYVWNGITRHQFLFSDSVETGLTTHAGTSDGIVALWGSAYNTQYTPLDPLVSNWAGFVLVKTQEVPEPSTLAIFALGVIGLASRRRKKQS